MNKKEDIYKITIGVFVFDQLIKYYINRFLKILLSVGASIKFLTLS